MTVNQTTHHNSFKLTAVPQTLPYHPTPPVLCASLSERFFIFARQETEDTVLVTSIDQAGHVTRHPPLPVQFIGGLAQGKDALHILGSRGQMLYDLRLDHAGRVLEETALSIGQDLLLTPQIVSSTPTNLYYWIDAQGQLKVQQGEQLFTNPLSNITLELVSTTTPTGLTFLRAAGIPGYLELLHFADGRIQQTHTIEGSEQGYCPLIFWREDQYLLLWVSRPSRSIRWQQFAADFSPLGQAQVLLTVNHPATLRWLRCLAARQGQIVLAWQIEEPGDDLNRQGMPLPALRQYIALLDPMQGELKGVTAVNFAAESYFTGCQLGEFLMVVLGGGQATVLTYQVS